MGVIFSSHYGRAIIVIAAGIVAGTIWWNGKQPSPPPANPTPWITFASQFSKVCAPGHRAELRFSETTFYVDMQWLSNLGLAGKDPGPTCPSGPVSVNSLFFYIVGRWPELKDTYLSHGLIFTYIQIDQLRNAGQIDLSLPSAPSTRVNLANGAYVEEITNENEKAISSSKRTYKIQHAKEADAPAPAPIRISCSGEAAKAPGRQCRSRQFYPPDLIIEYQFQQGGPLQHLVEHGMPDVAVPEPVGFVEADARLRQWLEELKQQP